MTNAVPETFRRVIDYALQEQVDFVVCPGDLFDSSRPSYADYHLFVKGMTELAEAGIPVYFCTGNHDPYTTWRHDFAAMPSNMHMFSAEHPSFFTFEKEGEPLVVLGGRGYLTSSFPASVDVSAGISREEALKDQGVEAPFVVGVMHSGLDVDPTRSPADPMDLMMRGVDYWALGHIHHYRPYPKKNPVIAFSGCPQARAIHETGPHGVVKVTLTQGAPNDVEFVPLASVEWHKVKVDVGQCLTIGEVQERIVAEQFSCNAESNGRDMIFRVRLTGRTELHGTLDQALLEELRSVINDSYPYFFIDAIVDGTKPVIDEASLAQEGLFPSVFLETSGFIADEELLAELDQEFRALGLTAPPSFGRKIGRLRDEANTLVLDLLNQEVGR